MRVMKVMRVMGIAFVQALAAALLAGAGDGQRLVDPFAGARPISDQGPILDPRDTSLTPKRGTAGRTDLERRAVEAAGIVGKGLKMWIAERTVAGRRMLFLRGWTGAGTGYFQVGILVFVPGERGSLRRVWWGIADEHVHPGGFTGMPEPPEWDIHGCLYIHGDALVYVRSRPPPAGRGGETPPVPPSGTYRWDGRRGGFVRAGAAPAGAWARCRREPDTSAPPARD
ncbi:MAG TPA: hypothetical protein VF771_11440 [Longimicrobiaceae bacterium]